MMDHIPHPTWAKHAMRYPCTDDNREDVTDRVVAEARKRCKHMFAITQGYDYVEWATPQETIINI